MEIFFLSCHCNFVTAFHFHHKAAKLNNAGLVFRQFVYVALQVIQERLDGICDPLERKENASPEQIRTPEGGPIWNDQRGFFDPMENYGMSSTTLKSCICPLQAVAFIV